ncbi:hypothetical protein [Algoriphagus sediminis]|uniref:Tripartite tricarboxylate transporter TctB family protein n=1 Tax=Algoriphagus sediminis TaxID=3057113 RepID=A0ABT7YBU6_9BACT|nr:hypothetical protein [Algoriphagus sediminis]MDN3203995.1 hypothetical protein [Algoriphagus sediminis]
MEKELTSKESLELITQMISKAKKTAGGDGGFQMLLWGWAVSLCNFGHYILAKLEYDAPYVVWTALIPVVGVSIWHGFKKPRQTGVRTHLDSVLNQLWLMVFIGIIIVLAFMSQLNFYQNPVILILASIGVFTTGAMVKEKLIKFGGVFLMVAALISFFMPITEQYLVAGIAIVIGYLVPGYTLKKG